MQFVLLERFAWRTHVKHLLAIYGQQSTENALSKTGTENDDVIFLLHGDELSLGWIDLKRSPRRVCSAQRLENSDPHFPFGASFSI